MHLHKHLGLLAVLSLLMSVPGTVEANLYGISMPGAPPLVSYLYEIDSSTGAAALIAPISGGFTSYSGAAFLGGQLFLTDLFTLPPPEGGYQNGWFGSVDISTGAFTAISDQDGSMNWIGLAGDQAGGLLYTIDWDQNFTLKSVTFSGTTTSIGTGTGVNGLGVGMAYDNVNDILYALDYLANSLYTVDTTTGMAALVGPLGIGGRIDGIGLDYDDEAGILYANALGSLYTVNVTTGAATLVGPNGFPNIDALAWLGQGGEPAIPEPATLSLLALGGLGLLHRRRKV